MATIALAGGKNDFFAPALLHEFKTIICGGVSVAAIAFARSSNETSFPAG
jgi:hypothetical protein